MALLDKSKNTPAFESDADGVIPDTKADTAVAVSKPAGAVSTQVGTADVFGAYRDALRVDYNTLSSVKLTSGNFVERETNVNLGDTIVFELLSYQDSYTVTPNVDKAPEGTLKFSDDGITCKDGTAVADHIAALKEMGYDKAGIKHRLVVVGAVQSAAKSDKLNDSLAQFDLSPETRVLFDRYRATIGYMTGKGRYTPEQAVRIKAVTRLVTKGSNTFTVADFSVAS